MPLNPSAQAAFMLGENVRRGLSGLGDRPLQEAAFNLDLAKTQHGIDRQRELDALQRPGLELQSEVAQKQLSEADQPFHMNLLMRDVNAVGAWMWTPEDEGKTGEGNKEPMITKFATMFGPGYNWDTQDGSQTQGMLLKPDGTPVSMGEIHQNAPRISAFIKANTGLDHLLQDSSDRTERDFQSGRITKPEYDKRTQRLKQIKDSPEMQAQMAQANIDYLSQFGNQGNPLFQSEITSGIQRWQKKLDTLSQRAAKAKETQGERDFKAGQNKLDRQLKRDLAATKERGADRRASLKGKEDTKLAKDLGSTQKDAMRQLAVSLGYGDDTGWGLDEKDVDKQGSYNHYLNINQALTGANPDKYRNQPAKLASDILKIDEGANQYANQSTQNIVFDDDADKAAEILRYKNDFVRQAFGMLPDPTLHPDKTMVDPKTQVRIKSINGRWVEVEKDQYGNDIPKGQKR